jgi:hypothetical protein
MVFGHVSKFQSFATVLMLADPIDQTFFEVVSKMDDLHLFKNTVKSFIPE